MSKIKVVHYINQFYAGIGGEEKADYPVELRKGEVIGPGVAFKSAFGDNAEIIATIICGDEYFQSAMGNVILKISEWIKELNPDVVVAGPAFNAGRYGTACACVCSSVQGTDIPAFTGMYKDNPAVRTYKDRICIFPTKNSAAGMKDAVELMAPFALKLGSQQIIGSAEVEGYMPIGYIPSPSARKNPILWDNWGTQSTHSDIGKKYETTPVSQPKPAVQKPQSEFRSTLVLKKTNFNSALNKIADFANSSVTPIKFRSVEEDSFIVFDRDVTGREFNRFLTKELLPQLETIQENQQKTIREFSSVYHTFDSLDKDYIAGIVHAVQSAEKASYQAVEASDQAKDASDEALRASSNVAQAQQDIRKTVEALGLTVKKLCEFERDLSRFKDRLERYDHLYDIDKLWEYVIELQAKCEKIEALKTTVKVLCEFEKDLGGFKDRLEKYKHLNDIDKLWEYVIELQAETKKVSDLELSIKGLLEFKEELSSFKNGIEKHDHLNDVDKLWEYVVELRANYEKSAKVTEYEESQNDTVLQKLKIAYAIAGTAVGISILHIILRVAGVL